MQSQIGIQSETGSFSGLDFRIDVPGAETGGRLTVIEMNVSPGAGAPPVHRPTFPSKRISTSGSWRGDSGSPPVTRNGN